MKAIQTLPPYYEQQHTVDLTSAKLTIGLNITGLLLLWLCEWGFMKLAVWLNPHYMPLTLRLFARAFSWEAFLLILFGTVISHELVHAFFFWILTGERPQIGFGLFYAYASAPAWYFPRNQFLVIGLAPLILITGVGLSLLPFVGFTAVSWIILALTLNAAGAAGDVYVCGRLLRYPPHILARDEGPIISLYGAVPF